MHKKLAALAIALGLFATQALPAFACGALVAPNGSVRLARAIADLLFLYVELRTMS